MTLQDLTNAQAKALADARGYYDGVTGYMLDGRLIVSAERYTWSEGYVPVVLLVDRDGTRRVESDDQSAQHWLQDARQRGRRI